VFTFLTNVPIVDWSRLEWSQHMGMSSWVENGRCHDDQP